MWFVIRDIVGWIDWNRLCFWLWTILAQNPGQPSTSLDPLGGGSGWVGAGLLGLVLGWLLLKHLPAKDQQIKDLIESRDKLMKDVSEAHDRSVIEAEVNRRNDFRESLKTVIEHCQRETSVLYDVMRKDMSEVSAAVLDLRRTLEELREAITANSAGVKHTLHRKDDKTTHI